MKNPSKLLTKQIDKKQRMVKSTTTIPHTTELNKKYVLIERNGKWW